MNKNDSFLSFIRTKPFFKHLEIAAVIAIVIIIALLQFLSSFTDHGQFVLVPDLRGIKFSETDNFLKNQPFKVMIADSVFEPKKPKGSILDQTPMPGEKVKENRTIYITVNASQPPKIKMPKIVDVSFRQAESLLETYGLKLGKTTYKPDFAKDAVLEQYYKGKPISPGTLLLKGSTIDLVLGDGLNGEQVELPFLIGKTRKEALAELNELQLTIGAEVFDETVKDSSKAFIYKQAPAYTQHSKVLSGKPIDLFYTADKEKIIIDTVQTND